MGGGGGGGGLTHTLTVGHSDHSVGGREQKLSGGRVNLNLIKGSGGMACDYKVTYNKVEGRLTALGMRMSTSTCDHCPPLLVAW